jgi:hypothetical protein
MTYVAPSLSKAQDITVTTGSGTRQFPSAAGIDTQGYASWVGISTTAGVGGALVLQGSLDGTNFLNIPYEFWSGTNWTASSSPYFQNQVTVGSNVFCAPVMFRYLRIQSTSAVTTSYVFQLTLLPQVVARANLGMPTVFTTATTAVSGNTAVWTPASGKKFRIMRYRIELSAFATATGGPLDIDVLLRDGASTVIPIAHTVSTPATATNAFGSWSTGWVDLGNGYLSTTANNVLNINPSVALAQGKFRVQVAGTEE